MVEKGGTDDEEEARKAYLAAREDSDRSAQKAIADKTSSRLLDRVTTKVYFFVSVINYGNVVKSLSSYVLLSLG